MPSSLRSLWLNCLLASLLPPLLLWGLWLRFEFLVREDSLLRERQLLTQLAAEWLERTPPSERVRLIAGSRLWAGYAQLRLGGDDSVVVVEHAGSGWSAGAELSPDIVQASTSPHAWSCGDVWLIGLPAQGDIELLIPHHHVRQPPLPWPWMGIGLGFSLALALYLYRRVARPILALERHAAAALRGELRSAPEGSPETNALASSVMQLAARASRGSREP